MKTANKDLPATRRCIEKARAAGSLRFSMALIGATSFVSIALSCSANAQSAQPNILFIVSDDTGYGDLGPYGGGEGRGMPTPNIDRLAAEGMTFFSFYAQPSCTPGRAAMQTGRIPNRSGMTTVAFQGQGGGLPAAEWTLASVLKTGRLQDLLHRQMASRRGRLLAAQRPGLRRDEELRALSPQRLHLCRSDLVPGHAGGLARHVREGHQRFDVRQCRRDGQGGFQDQRPVCRHAGDRRQGRRRRHSLLRRLRREGRERIPRRGRQDAQRAVLHQRELHEGSPAEHAGAGVRAQVAVEVEIRRTRWSSWTPVSAGSWTSCAKPAWTRTRWFSTRPTMAPGRTYIPTPAIRHSAAPRARCAKAATAFPRSPSGRARSSRAPRTTRSSAAST